MLRVEESRVKSLNQNPRLSQLKFHLLFRAGFCRCVDKNNGIPIFGITTGKTESLATGQKCDCARNYYEGLE